MLLLLIYPLLAALRSGIFRLVDCSTDFRQKKVRLSVGLLRKIGAVWGFWLLSAARHGHIASRIYSRQHTRVDASEWIYANIPGPINLISSQAERDGFSSLPVRVFDQVQPGEISLPVH